MPARSAGTCSFAATSTGPAGAPVDTAALITPTPPPDGNPVPAGRPDRLTLGEPARRVMTAHPGRRDGADHGRADQRPPALPGRRPRAARRTPRRRVRATRTPLPARTDLAHRKLRRPGPAPRAPRPTAGPRDSPHQRQPRRSSPGATQLNAHPAHAFEGSG